VKSAFHATRMRSLFVAETFRWTYANGFKQILNKYLKINTCVFTIWIQTNMNNILFRICVPFKRGKSDILNQWDTLPAVILPLTQ
jgi:hypothetical protein